MRSIVRTAIMIIRSRMSHVTTCNHLAIRKVGVGVTADRKGGVKMLYKVLKSDGSPAHGGSGIWPLPKDGRPGERKA
jgi:hypothetical protein